MTDPPEGNAKRQIGARIEEDLLKEVRILAIRQGRRFNELIEESLRDLLKKHRDKPKGKG